MPRDEAYRKAEKIIEKARYSGVKERNLSHLDLTELPETLKELTQLRSLDISNNHLAELPRG